MTATPDATLAAVTVGATVASPPTTTATLPAACRAYRSADRATMPQANASAPDGRPGGAGRGPADARGRARIPGRGREGRAGAELLSTRAHPPVERRVEQLRVLAAEQER
ncbi:hypothetical protein BRC81_10165 [Halobacteriales archaeon QS_1_68_20]|nr:MAG: hypothetical protein BRC81_10165 [Halobacteriales archaeon QS_1_68_20]